MILADTRVWIDFFQAKPTPQVNILEMIISEGHDICVCGLVLTEVLQGIRNDKQYHKTKTYFDNLLFLSMNKTIYTHAADMYRYLRKRGITVRKSIDCMIASVAITNDIYLLHNDRDFIPIEKYCGLKTIKCKK